MADNVEQEDAIRQYLKDGIVTEKIEWLDKDLDELHPALRAKECGRYTEQLQKICAENGKPYFSQVHGPDLHGPVGKCRLLVLASYSVSTPEERPMFLGCDGRFNEPSLQHAVEPIINTMTLEKGCNRAAASNLIYKTTCVFDCVPISFTSKMASSSKPEDIERWKAVKEKTKVYAKMMFHDLADLLLVDDVMCIAVGAIARELAPHLLEGTNIKLMNENIPLPHPSRSKNG